MEQLVRVPVGLEDIVDDFERTMIKGHKNVQIVGIVGRGGCGKTTLAKELYSRKCTMMKRSSFLPQVGSTAAEHALIKLQKRLVGDLLPDSLVKDLPFCSIYDGKKIVASHLRSVRVLLVLDDVDHTNQLDALLPGKENLACGSLIIVTTRHSKLLTSWGICSIYEMKGLDPLHAEQLLCRHAFLGSSPPDEFKSYVEMFVRLCDGLPLMIKVLGQLLQGNSQEYWEAQLNKMIRKKPTDTREMLKLHFLTFSKEEQEIFLDIACFFIGEEKSLAFAVWEGLGWNGMHSWEMLENKFFVELDEKKRIRMHDDLRDFGKEIAISRLPCRLWSPEQIVNIQKDKRAIRGIMAATSQFVVCSAHEEFPTYSAYYRPQFKDCMELIKKSSRSLNLLPASSHELDPFPSRPLKPLSASSHESEPLYFSSTPLKALPVNPFFNESQLRYLWPLLGASNIPSGLPMPKQTPSIELPMPQQTSSSMFEDESIITSRSQFRMPQDASSDMITSRSQLTMPQDTSSSIITSLSQFRMPQDVSSSIETSRSQFLMPQDASSSIITSRSQLPMSQDASSTIITSRSQLPMPQDTSSNIIRSLSQFQMPQGASSDMITSRSQLTMPQDTSSSIITSLSQFRMPQGASSDMITSRRQFMMCRRRQLMMSQDTSSSIITSLSQFGLPQDVSSSITRSRNQFLMPQDASSSIITSRSQLPMSQDASSTIITSRSQLPMPQDTSSNIIRSLSQFQIPQGASSDMITSLWQFQMPQGASSDMITSRRQLIMYRRRQLMMSQDTSSSIITSLSQFGMPQDVSSSITTSHRQLRSRLQLPPPSSRPSPSSNPFPLLSRPLALPSSSPFPGQPSRRRPRRPLKLRTASSMGFYFLVVRGSDFTEEYAALSEDLVWLRWFDFNHSSLPPWLSLKNLRVLELYGALNLKELWNYNASEPLNLRELIISSSWGSSFESFPPSISNLRHLRKIALIGYIGDEFRIQGLPEDFCLLTTLEHLELRHCKSLSTLPTDFGRLGSLQHLDLCSCEALRTLPLSFKNLKNLQYLDLSGCRKLAFRLDILEYMTHLENLYLSGCLKLEELPNIENQACLRQLHLQDTNLLDIPTNIDQLSKLQVLTIGSPLLTSLPHSLRDLSSLNSLSIIDCIDLGALPPSLEHLNLLECLYIKSSGVTSLAIWQFANLKTLKICDCPIGELDFGQRHSMKKLKLINVSQTLVKRISISEDCCPVLEILQLEQNDHLVKIEILPTTVKIVELTDCELLNDITGIDDLVNLQIFEKSGCPQLDKL